MQVLSSRALLCLTLNPLILFSFHVLALFIFLLNRDTCQYFVTYHNLQLYDDLMNIMRVTLMSLINVKCHHQPLLQHYKLHKYRTENEITNITLRQISIILQKKLQFVATKFKNSKNMLIIRLIRLSVLELQPLTTMVIFKSTRLYDKQDDFSFVIIHFPPLDNNIPATPEYGNYITFEAAV